MRKVYINGVPVCEGSGGVGAGVGVMQTYSFAMSDNPSLDVTSNSATFGGVIVPACDTVVSGIQCVVTQTTASGYVQGAIYDEAYEIVGLTSQESVGTSGSVEMELSSSVTLECGQRYTLAISCTGNGARFASLSNVGNSWNYDPKPSARQLNNRLPSTLDPDQSTSLIWLAAKP